MMGSATSRPTVQAVERALDVLLCLGQDPDLGPTEIGERLGLHKSTVHRLLRALATREFVTQDDRTERYQLGPAALRLAHRLVLRPDLVTVAQPILNALRDETQETAVIDVRIGDYRVCVAQAESLHEIRRAQRIGLPMEIYAGAIGKILLMELGQTELEVLVQRVSLTALTPNTPRSLRRLREDIARARRDGVIVSMSERVPGATTVATAVRDASGMIVAGLGVTGPSFRFVERRVREAIPHLIDAAQRISIGLGASPQLPSSPRARGNSTPTR